jgi:uncharacterized membrane protein
MTVIYALLAAAGYGCADFLAGVTSRRSDATLVSMISQGVAGVVVLVMCIVSGAHNSMPALLWGALAGVGSGFGVLALYRGFSIGRMSVVAPVSAVTVAAVPALVGVLLGERPSTIAWIGIALAIPATWLIGRVGDEHIGPSGFLEGLGAGLAFSLMFIGLHGAGNSSGLWPVVWQSLVAVLVLFPLALPLWAKDNGAVFTPIVLGGVVLSGILAGLGSVWFLIASSGGLAISSVITSLYPAFTVLLAFVLLRERVRHVQAVGLFLAAASVVLVTV